MAFYGMKQLSFDEYVVERPADLSYSENVVFFLFNVNKADNSFSEYTIYRYHDGKYLFRYDSNVLNICLDMFWSRRRFERFIHLFSRISASWSVSEDVSLEDVDAYSIVFSKMSGCKRIFSGNYPANYRCFIRMINSYFRVKSSDNAINKFFRVLGFDLSCGR